MRWRNPLLLAPGAVLCAAWPGAALAQDDAAPLAETPPALPAEPCAPVQRTSPEFLIAFAPLDPTVTDFADAATAEPAALPAIPQPPRDVAAAERFLASGLLPIARTAWDAQWRRVRDRGLDAACAALLLGDAAGETKGAAIAAVNAWVNHHVRYVAEPAGDRWLDAAETLRARRGDCEDIAVLKLQLLVALGVPAGDLYLTLVRDLVRNADHAVLVVRSDNAFWVLDDASDRVLDAAASNDYRAVVSFSGARKWVHGY